MIRETILTGMRLADALAVLAAIDSRYEWQEMNGVIVFRPVQAWRDGLNPLFLPVPDVRLQRVTLSTVMGVIASALKAPEHASNTIVDTRRMSIDIPAGSVVDLLNAAAKAPTRSSSGRSSPRNSRTPSARTPRCSMATSAAWSPTAARISTTRIPP